MPGTTREADRRLVSGAALALRIALLALAGALCAWTVFAVWSYAWRDLYADGWRIYARYLTLTFPRNVLEIENGHRPVIPALIRVAELHFLDANQKVQWAIGLLLSAGSVVVGGFVLLRDRAVAPLCRAASLLALAVAVLWLGNARMLMHPTESVQTYLVVFSLVAAASIASSIGTPGTALAGRLAACMALALIATFSFGLGIVVFPALVAALAIARAPRSALAALVLAMLVALALYLALPGGRAVPHVIAFDPWGAAQVLAQWLAAPVAIVVVRGAAGTSWAAALETRIVPWGAWPGSTTWIGIFAVTLLVLGSARVARQAGVVTRTRFVGLALAWFAVGSAAIVALARLSYFRQYPDQLLAPRYLPWGCLLFGGLALAALGARARSEGRPSASVIATAAIAVTTAVAIAALAIQPEFAGWSRRTQALARHQAIAVVADLYGASQPAGENVAEEVRAASPLLRAQRTYLFAHPAVARLGTVLRDAPLSLAAHDATAEATLYASDGGIPAVDFVASMPRADETPSSAIWLVTNGDREVVGFAHPSPLDARDRIAGVARRDAGETLLAFPWIEGRGPGTGIRVSIQPKR